MIIQFLAAALAAHAIPPAESRLLLRTIDQETGAVTASLLLCEDSVRDAAIGQGTRDSRPVLNIVLHDAAAEILADMTGKNVGLPMETVLDGEIISRPTIWEQIAGGHLQLTGFDDREQLQRIVSAAQAPCPEQELAA